MAEAYFVPRSELLAWINSTLCLRLTKVEETANGAVACQLLDALYPNTVPMKKVDFNAKNDYDMINNYKVMQDVFNKLGVDKHVDVNKLIKGRPLDNTEFMQWFKAYWDKTTGGCAIDDYDPVSRRLQCKTGGVKGSDGPASAAKPAAGSAAAAAGALPQRRVPVTYAGKQATTPPPAAAASRSKRSLIGSSSSNHNHHHHAAAAGGGVVDAEALEHLQEEVSTWRAAAETCTKEKDFYYSKLRAIELLCNTPGITGNPIAKAVEDILYAATQEEGEELLAAAIAQLEVRGYDDAVEHEQHEGEVVQHHEQEEEQDAAHHMAAASAGSSRRVSSQHSQQHYASEQAATAAAY